MSINITLKYNGKNYNLKLETVEEGKSICNQLYNIFRKRFGMSDIVHFTRSGCILNTNDYIFESDVIKAVII